MNRKFHVLILSLLTLIMSISPNIYAQDSVRVSTIQLKQANKVFAERDYYYKKDSLNNKALELYRQSNTLLNNRIEELDTNVLYLQAENHDLKIDLNNENKKNKFKNKFIFGSVAINICLFALLLIK